MVSLCELENIKRERVVKSLASPSRGDARLVIAGKWAVRRKLTEKNAQTITTDHNTSQSTRSSNVEFSIPPLCIVLRRSWNQTINGITQKTTPSSTRKPLLKQGDKRSSFPSVLRFLKANAIKLQVESMENNIDDLIILPSRYDFVTSAVNHMSHSRSRAFLLTDCSAIVETFILWRKRLPKRGVQMVYSARHNCNEKLLKLLHRLGVGLRVATSYDLTAVTTSTLCGGIIFDDPHILLKPNSFYRNLVLETEDLVCMIPIVVDSSEEIERIHDQLCRICERRKQRMPGLQFILKLNNIDVRCWKKSLIQLHKISFELSNEVVGVALELGKVSKITNRHNDEMDDNLLLDALSDLIENWAHRLPGKTLPQVHLTNPVNLSEIESNLKFWVENHYKSCNGIIIDVSRLLMADVAALCTRIIGVKNIDEHSQYIYIDDGLYGSLSNYPSQGTPLALKGQNLYQSEFVNDNFLSEKENDQKALVKTTVWGPTCDGLDKVCSNITLPRLSRDDWLVFPDLGFCNEGTQFNGFLPPDIACCILGG